jgi:4-nitrophenyl phosphatase
LSEVAAIVLAAGPSARYGRPKQLLDWNGVPLVTHVSNLALAAGLRPVIVVLGSEADSVRAALAGLPVTVLINWRWEEGLSTSVRTGLSAVPAESGAAVLLQCDQPLLTPAFLQALVDRQRETGAAVVYPVHEGTRGTPVLFARALFPELAHVDGDQGGRAILDRHSEETSTVEVADPDILADVDTPPDYKRLRKRITSRAGDAAVLRPVRGLMVDMDGVLWRGDQPIPALQRFFAFLADHSIAYVLVTNNSSKLPRQYVTKLAGFGVRVDESLILTSGQAAAAYLADATPRGTRIYTIGEQGVDQPLQERGFVIAAEDASYVVVGWDRDLTWKKLATAALLIHGGAGFVGTNPDTSFPTERGPVPGNGAQLAALEAATGVAPFVVGKPGARMYLEALMRLGTAPEETAVLGDRLDTDIAGAKRAGLAAVLVLSGIATEADLARAPERPDLVCSDIGELTSVWERALAQ